MSKTWRLIMVGCCVAGALALGWRETSRAGAAPGSFLLRTGDTLRIAKTDIGCAVARRNGETMIECLPAHRRAGAYATLTGDGRVLVVRFRTPKLANTVFHAKQHDPDATTCR